MVSVGMGLSYQLLSVAVLAQPKVAACVVRHPDRALSDGVGEGCAKRVVALAPEDGVPEKILVSLLRADGLP